MPEPSATTKTRRHKERRPNSLCLSVTRTYLLVFLTKFFGRDTPLLPEEGWTRHQEDIAKPPLRSGRGGRSHAVFKTHSEIWLVCDHPVYAAFEGSRHLPSGAAAPPLGGREYPARRSFSKKSGI